MVNATDMARPFDRRPSKWLELTSTKEFLRVLSDARNKDITKLVTTKRGNFSNNTEQGTWFDEEVALEFSRWLSPAFSIWCNGMIKELLQKGSVSLQTVSRRDLAIMILESESEIKELKSEVSILKPKAEYVETIFNSKGTLTTTEIAKSFDVSAVRLNKILHDLRIIYPQSRGWFLYSKYQGKDYTKMKTYYDEVANKSHIRTVWTHKGRMFLYDILKEKGILNEWDKIN